MSLLPWETTPATPLAWEGSFIYPRTISILRAPAETQHGKQGYNGLAPGQLGQINPRNWPAILSGLPASIQAQRIGSDPEEKLPSDARGKSTWRIFIPVIAAWITDDNGNPVLADPDMLRLLVDELISDRDVVADDLGRLFHVIAAYGNSLGYDLFSEILET